MKSLLSLFTSLLLAATTTACIADASTQATDAESSEESDLAGSRRRLTCNLEYARYSPDFRVVLAASFDELMSKVNTEGATASDGRFAFESRVNPTPPYNLAFQVSIRDLATGKNVSYSVLPKPRLGGDFLFELGARIEPITIPTAGVTAVVTTTEEQFDFVRSYCSLYLPE